MKTTNIVRLSTIAIAIGLLAGCASESSRTITPEQTAAATRTYTGPRSPIAVGKFDNRSDFMRGVFSDNVDRLGNQAKTILMTHLQQSGRFSLLDRTNLDEIKQEAHLGNQQQTLKGARYVVTGDVTEFGRKQTGDMMLFGLLGRGKEQVAYAKVALNIVDVRTGAVVYSVMGAGEYALSNREIVGFGGTAQYDATLNGKVLDLAIREAVEKLVAGVESDAWRPAN